MRCIVITSPHQVPDEASKIVSLLGICVDYVHILKPGYSPGQIRQLIEQIPERLRHRLTLHDHYGICRETGVGGIHLNARNSRYIDNPALCDDLSEKCKPLRISRSLHSLPEIYDTESSIYEYRTLSPIFDSISKEGYRAAFDLYDMDRYVSGRRIVALGGVIPDRIGMLSRKGFWGVALLGYIWRGDFDTALRRLDAAISPLIQVSSKK